MPRIMRRIMVSYPLVSVVLLETARTSMATTTTTLTTSHSAFGYAAPFTRSREGLQLALRYPQHSSTHTAGQHTERTSFSNPFAVARNMKRRHALAHGGGRTTAHMCRREGGDSFGHAVKSLLPFASGVIPTVLTSGASAVAAGTVAAEGARVEMGARLDPGAAVSFGVVIVAFAFLQARIRTAIKGRTARRDYEAVLKGVRNQRLAGTASDEDVLAAEERMAQLMIEEQDARKVDILGVPFNLVIPDGGAGGGTSSTANGQSEAGVGTGLSSDSGSLGTRDRSRTQQAQNDLRDGRAREEDMTPAATLKVAALWLVLISQLWLLLVFWNDPMGPASSAFLRD